MTTIAIFFLLALACLYVYIYWRINRQTRRIKMAMPLEKEYEEYYGGTDLNLDASKLQNFRMKAYQTIRILDKIEIGQRNAELIAKQTNSDIKLVEYYLKALNCKVEKNGEPIKGL